MDLMSNSQNTLEEGQGKKIYFPHYFKPYYKSEEFKDSVKLVKRKKNQWNRKQSRSNNYSIYECLS